MNEKLIVQMIEIILAITAGGGIIIVLAATWHDMRSIAQRARLRTTATDQTRTRQLPVAILIYATDTLAIKACLDSIINNKFEKCRIIITGKAEASAVKEIVTNYNKSRPNSLITILTVNKSRDRASALHTACKKVRKNELIFILDATDVLSCSTIPTAVAHFIAHPNLDATRSRRLVLEDITIKSLPDYFTALTMNMFGKAASNHVITRKNLDRSGTIFRSRLLTPDMASKKISFAYSSTITFSSPYHIQSTTTPPLHRATAFGIVIASLTCIGIMTYFFYTAAALQSNTLLVLSWTLVSLWLVAIVWSDEMLNLSKKITLTFSVPFMYFLFYVQLFIQLTKNVQRLMLWTSKPRINLKAIHTAILHEAYSTRF